MLRNVGRDNFFFFFLNMLVRTTGQSNMDLQDVCVVNDGICQLCFFSLGHYVSHMLSLPILSFLWHLSFKLLVSCLRCFYPDVHILLSSTPLEWFFWLMEN